MLRLLKSMARSMYATIARFPVTVMVSLTLGILLVYGNHHRNLPDLYTRINMTLGLAIPLTALATLAAGRFSQASRRKLFPWVLVAFQLAAGLLLFAYWLYMTPIGEDTGVYRNLRGFKLMGLVSVAALGFFAAQHFPRRKGFVMHVIRILIRILVTAIFTGVLCGGLDAIIFAADQLFDLNISNRIYTDVVFLVITVFTPLYFFGGVPLLSGKEDAGEEDTGKAGTEDYPGFLKVLFLYIVLPLLSVYMIIVLLYCLRVLLAGQPWPENRLATLAFPVAPILTASLFLIAPLARIYRWPRIAISVLPIAVLPLFAMMFAGLAIRTQAYGMTEQRYFVWVMGGWAALVMIGMIYQRVKKTSGNGFQGVLLPVTLAVAVFFMVLGPVNAYRISQNSQNERLSRLFGSYGLLREGEIDREKLEARPAFSTEDRMEIQEILEYFRMKYSLSRVKVLNSFTEKDEIYALLGFDKPYPNMPYRQAESWFNLYLEPQMATGMDIHMYDLFIALSQSDIKRGVQNNNGYAAKYDPAGTVEILSDGDVIMQISLKDWMLEKIRQQGGEKAPTQTMASMMYETASGGFNVRLIVKQANGRYSGEDSATLGPDWIELDGMEAWIFVQVPDGDVP